MTNAGPIVQLLLDSPSEQASLRQLLSVDSTWQVLGVDGDIDVILPSGLSAQPDVILLDASIYQTHWCQIQLKG